MKKIIILISLVFLIAIPAQAENSIRNENQTTLYTTEADTGPMQSVDRFGNLQCSLRAGTASATNPIKLEDSAHTSGDAGVFGLGVYNAVPSSYTATDGNYTPIGVNRGGGIFADLRVSMQGNAGAGPGESPVRSEDAAFTDTNAVMVSAGQALSAIVQSVGASGDVGPLSMDLGNRLVTTKAPLGEMTRGCSSAIVTNTTGQIFAGSGSKFSFVTSWDCTNTGATATRVILEDADGNDLANGFLAATTGFFSASFNDIPAYSAATNKAIQVNVITTGSSTICCARGYYGVQ